MGAAVNNGRGVAVGRRSPPAAVAGGAGPRQRLAETRATAEAVATRAAVRRVVEGDGTMLGRHADVNKPFIGNEHRDRNRILEALMQSKAPK